MFSVSTRAFYDRSAAAMSSISAKTATLSAQIATGKRILDPSDDSVGYQRLGGLKGAAADAKADKANLSLAGSILAQADSNLGAIGDQLQRASELAIQARGAALDQPARSAIAAQLRGVIGDIVGLANTADVRGAPLFGGSGDAAAVTLKGSRLSFAAGQPSAIPTGDGQSVQPSANASTFLSANGSDIAQMLTALAVALETNTGVDAASTTAQGGIDTIADQVTSTQASIGARAARVEMDLSRLSQAATDREEARSAIEDVDPVAAYTELQKQMTILQATQASFSKLSGLSLFDYLR